MYSFVSRILCGTQTRSAQAWAHALGAGATRSGRRSEICERDGWSESGIAQAPAGEARNAPFQNFNNY